MKSSDADTFNFDGVEVPRIQHPASWIPLRYALRWPDPVSRPSYLVWVKLLGSLFFTNDFNLPGTKYLDSWSAALLHPTANSNTPIFERFWGNARCFQRPQNAL